MVLQDLVVHLSPYSLLRLANVGGGDIFFPSLFSKVSVDSSVDNCIYSMYFLIGEKFYSASIHLG